MKYLFYIAKFYSIPIIQPMVKYLDTTSGNNYAILVSKKVKERLVKERIWLDKNIITTIKEGQNFNPNFCLSPGNYVDFRLPGIKVEIFHGIGIEKESHYQIRHFFDVYLTSGPVITERFDVMSKKWGYFLVRETGWPKMDYILKYPVENIKQKFNIPDNKNIILYAPTFSKKMESGSELLPIIPNIIKDNEIWLLKFHEFMDKDLVKSIKKSGKENIIILDTYDITPYLHISDVMISDTSSVLYEFMVLDKPVITFNTMKRKDKGIDISSPKDLRSTLDRVLADPAEHSALRKRHMDEVNPYLDGSISKNIFSVLEKIKVNNELSKKKKPLNLFRKLRILYNEKFKQGYLK